MNISLTPELEDFVKKKIESGLFQDPIEVIREGLLLLREVDEINQKKLDDLRKEIAIGIEQIKNGQVAPLNIADTLARVRAKRLAKRSEKN